MDLKEFVKKVLIDLVQAVEETRAEAVRDMHLSDNDQNRTIEFDIAVSAEENLDTSGKAGIKVLQFIEGGGSISKGSKNSTVSRVKFGIKIGNLTKEEEGERDARIANQFSKNREISYR